MTVQRLSVKDAPAMALLHAEGFDRPWSADDFAGFLTKRTYAAFGIVRDEKLQAFILYQQIPPELELCSLVVTPKFRREGLARTLITDSLANFGDISNCYLEVNEHNTAARSLYASLGFEVSTVRSGYYRSRDGSAADAIVMMLEIH